VTHSEKNAEFGHRTIELEDGWMVNPAPLKSAPVA
jgi:hypothetical protein